MMYQYIDVYCRNIKCKHRPSITPFLSCDSQTTKYSMTPWQSNVSCGFLIGSVHSYRLHPFVSIAEATSTGYELTPVAIAAGRRLGDRLFLGEGNNGATKEKSLTMQIADVSSWLNMPEIISLKVEKEELLSLSLSLSIYRLYIYITYYIYIFIYI